MFASQELLKYREALLFKTSAAAFDTSRRGILKDLETEYLRAGEARRDEIAGIIAELTIDLGSYLTRWNLLPPESLPAAGEAVEGGIRENLAVLDRWGRREGSSRVRGEIADIRKSNFVKLSRLADRGLINSRWGNDSAVGLARAARRGAVLITTNPVMINNVRKTDPEYWAGEKAVLQKKYAGFPPEKLASYMTMEVVRKNCEEFRPLYEATRGRYGYVCLQVNPRNSKDPESMAREALELYGELGKDHGGKPNAAFKIPGTAAGLRAAKVLAEAGVPVTMTASASVSQMIAMASILEKGKADVSFLTVMNGRLDDPVGEELEAKGVANGREIARWGSTFLIRKAYRILYGDMGIKMPTILAASLRGPWNIEGSITAGAKETFITAFPDKAAEYDEKDREILSHMDEEMPKSILDTLNKSGIFRKAFYPEELSESGFDDFYPVKVTLEQFEKNYEEFLEYISH
jgi:transaldolase